MIGKNNYWWIQILGMMCLCNKFIYVYTGTNVPSVEDPRSQTLKDWVALTKKTRWERLISEDVWKRQILSLMKDYEGLWKADMHMIFCNISTKLTLVQFVKVCWALAGAFFDELDYSLIIKMRWKCKLKTCLHGPQCQSFSHNQSYH